MLTLIENGEVYAPAPLGRRDLLVIGDKIGKLGAIDRRALERSGLDIEVIDASDCFVTPGLIDPHQHLLGGSGERGFSSQTPEIFPSEIASAGITTVVGCLGVDTTTKTMRGLLARAKALNGEGLTAYIYSGGYPFPPATITGSVRDDLMIVDEVIGAGEVAISDLRASEPSLDELARIASEAYTGGLLSGKAGVTHLHVGDDKRRLAPLRGLLSDYAIEARSLYPTHVERNKKLLEEAAALTRHGVFVDIDTVERDLSQSLASYIDHDGDLRRLTISSDAAISSPRTLYEQMRACIREGMPLEMVLTLATANTAEVLKMGKKGALEPGRDADLLLIDRDSLEIVEVIARGKHLVRGGRLLLTESFLAESNRKIELHGQKQ